jgi:hydroxymethylbilane synthase
VREILDIFNEAPLRLASRASQLAMCQAELVKADLAPVIAEILPVTTIGDRVLDRPLADVGGKGLFIKELERSILAGASDAAVHSMKDMETSFAPGTEIAAVLSREDRRDALLGKYATLDDLPSGAIVGTSSVRRRALLLHHRPDVNVKLLRGNINRRIGLLQDGEYDAIILAVAGLKRLGLDVEYTPLAPEIMPTAAAQGALAVQVASPDDDRKIAVRDAFAGMNCKKANAEVTAERAVLAHLDGSCHTPIAASAEHGDDGMLYLDAMVLRPDGSAAHRRTINGPVGDAAKLGSALGEALLIDAGGRDFLA